MGISEATISGSYEIGDDWGDATSLRHIDRVAALLIWFGAWSPYIHRFVYTCSKDTLELQIKNIHAIWCVCGEEDYDGPGGSFIWNT